MSPCLLYFLPANGSRRGRGRGRYFNLKNCRGQPGLGCNLKLLSLRSFGRRKQKFVHCLFSPFRVVRRGGLGLQRDRCWWQESARGGNPGAGAVPCSISMGGLKDVSTLVQLLLHRPLVGRCPEMCSGWLTHCTLFMDRRKAKLKGSQALDHCAAAFVVLVVFNA